MAETHYSERPQTPMTALLLLQAVDFAAHKHRDERRKDHRASPYINHPVAVALLVAEVAGVIDPELLSAALLHDTLEDTDTIPEEIEAAFGARVRSLVEEVTDKKLPQAERKRLEVEHAHHLSADAALIKMADKLANVRDVTHAPPADWSLDRRREYLEWADAVVRACPPVSEALAQSFKEALEEGRRELATRP
jgi:guanosine-3',5'-bis(diphosphate) 3'-pyrophosphohydrolase